MKHNWLFTLFLIFSKFLLSQNIGVYYSKNYLGNNLKIGYSVSKKANVWTEFGLEYFLNRKSYYDIRYFAYYKHGYAENPINHLGLFVKRASVFYENYYGLKVYALGGFDYLNCATKLEIHEPTGQFDSIGFPTYRSFEITFEKFHSLELNLGLGAQVKIAKKMNLVLETGASGVFIYHPYRIGPNINGYTAISNPTLEIDYIGWMAKIGVNYLISR
jgi:hypothetical protein